MEWRKKEIHRDSETVRQRQGGGVRERGGERKTGREKQERDTETQ